MCTQPLVAVVQAQVQECLDIAVPHVQVNRDGALALAELVDADGGVVELLDPRHHAAGGVGHAADGRSGRAHVAQVGTHAAAVLGHARYVGIGVIDALQAVVHGVDEARGQLAPGLAGVGQGGCGHGHVQVGQRPVGLAHQAHAPDAAAVAAEVLVLHQVQRDGQPALLRQLVDRARVVGGQVAGGQQVQTVVGEQQVAVGLDHASGLFQLFLGIGVEDVDGVHVAVGQALLQPHVGAVLEAGIIEAVLAGALVQPAQVQPGGKMLPVRCDQVDARFGLADQQVHQFIGAEPFAALHQRHHAALVIGQVQVRELGMHLRDGAQQAGRIEGHAPVAALLGDPQTFGGRGGRVQQRRGIGDGGVFVVAHRVSMRCAVVASRCRHRNDRAGVMEAGGSTPVKTGSGARFQMPFGWSHRAAVATCRGVTRNRAWRKRGADEHNIVWVCLIVNIICWGEALANVTKRRSRAAGCRRVSINDQAKGSRPPVGPTNTPAPSTTPRQSPRTPAARTRTSQSPRATRFPGSRSRCRR
ncbi:hypothetical protein D3C86_420980 [compost metagenome]